MKARIPATFTTDQRNMSWTFLPGDGKVGLRNARCAITINEKRYDWAEADTVEVSKRAGANTVHLTFAAGVAWKLEFRLSANGKKLTIASSVTNTGNDIVILGPLALIDIGPAQGGRLALKGSPADFTVFQQQGWNTRVESLTSNEGVHTSEFIGHVYSPKAGRVTRPKGETGSLSFLMPDGFRLVNHEGHKLMKDGRDNSVLIRRDFEFTTKNPVPFTLRFERFGKGQLPCY